MKGISHFISGVALASCCPWTVDAALNGNPSYFILGAIFGLLPDTIDFKFYRFFYHYDQIITPDPSNPDPQAMADQLAEAVDAALTNDGIYRLKVNTLQLSADQWRQFKIRFDTKRQAVEVQLGPIVTTGQIPVPGTLPKNMPLGCKKLSIPINKTYEAVTTVDIFDGPAFGLEKDADGRLTVHFLPWHRNWTHSLVVAGALAGAVVLVAGWRAGLVAFGASAVHILEDQLGFMGSNLFAPFTCKRVKGLCWMRSGDALPNFATVWFCCLLIFWNCYRAMPDPLYHFGFLRLMLYGGIIPLGIFGLLHLLLSGKSSWREPIDTSTEWGEDRA